MAISPNAFPLDLTGTDSRNLITNDNYTFATAADKVFIPAGGPFYTRTLVVRSGTTILKPNVDYKCLHLLRDATVASGLDVSAIIMITKDSVNAVTLSYQVIGGEYANTVPVIRQLLANADNIDPSINWNTQVYAKPDLYPPAPHFVSGDEFSDWGAVVMGLQAVERSILLKDVAAWESMYQYLENLISNKISYINLTNYATLSYVNGQVGTLAPKTTVYTKEESDARYYTKAQVETRIGDIDSNETYYTEKEINAKFIEGAIADAKFATKAELNRIGTLKADVASVYTRAQTDDKYIEKTKVYTREWVDANLVLKGASYLKSESDTRYAFKTDAYTRVESDNRFALKSQIPQAQDLTEFIKADYVDNTFLRITTADSTYLRKTTADSVYAKITDLAQIKTLSDKFALYYTKLEDDAKFATKAYVDSNFLNKTQLTQQFLPRLEASSTYATKSELTVTDTNLKTAITLKSDTTWVNTNFVTKASLATTHYTKVESDAKYYDKNYINTYYPDNSELAKIVATLATKTSVTDGDAAVKAQLANYYTKTETKSLYYDKVYSDATYLTKNVYNSFVATTNAAINAKAATTWVTSTFYTKTDSDAKYALKSTLETNYMTSALIGATYVTKTSLATDLANYLLKTDFNNKWTGLNTELTKFALKADVYTKVESDDKYIAKTAPRIEIKGNSTNAESFGIDLVNISASGTPSGSIRFFVNSDKNGIIYTVNDYTNKTAELRLALKNFVDGTVPTALIVNNNGIWHKTYGWLHTRFLEVGEAYSKAEADANFMSIKPSSINVTGANGDISIARTNPADSRSPALNYLRGPQNLGRTYMFWNATTSQWNYDLSIPATAAGAIESTMRVTTTDIWHRVYGNLDTYFRLASDSYTKADVWNKNESYSKVQAGDTFYTKALSDGKYATITTLNDTKTSLTNLINVRPTQTWVDTNLFTRTQSDARYFTQAQITADYYNKATSDLTFATKTALSAEAAKKVDLTTYNTNNTALNTAISKKLDTTTASTTYATITAMNDRVLKADLVKSYLTSTDTANTYYSKTLADGKFATLAGLKEVNDDLQNKYKYLVSRLQMYKVGDIFITTNNFINSAAVATHVGYGIWERYAQGRAIVGVSPNGWTDGVSYSGTDIATLISKYNASTKTMGTFYGEHSHAITVEEMPRHKHSANEIFNKFSARGLDVLNRETAAGFVSSPFDNPPQYNVNANSTAAWVYYGGRDGEGITTTAGDNKSSGDELMINGFTAGGWTAATEEYRGSDHPLAMGQPSVVVGIWRRTQ